MKKILVIASFALLTFSAISCGDKAKEKATTEEAAHKHADAYQCPMDCENGKTYDKPGTCPTCKMDLKKVEHKH
jgi:uncharacterized paraquat-inducible protein A